MSSRRVALLCAAISLVCAAVGTAVGVSVASHDFPDVGDGSFFHDAIDQIAGAGCATGFPDGNFQPQSDVRRQQFAFWLNNCGGRASTVVADGDFITDGDDFTAAELTVETGGAPDVDAWGLWYVVADVDVSSSGAQQSTWRLERALELGFEELDEDRLSVIETGIVSGGLPPTDSGTLTALVPGPAAGLESFRVTASRENGAPNAEIEVRLTAVYVPFTGAGDAFVPN